MPKFLVDECLSLNLVEVARSRGFPESSHVVDGQVWLEGLGTEAVHPGGRLDFFGAKQCRFPETGDKRALHLHA